MRRRQAVLAAASLLPPRAAPALQALAGVQAIRDGDPRGVIEAAMNLVPAGPAKTVIRVASVVIRAVPRLRKARQRRRR